MSNLLSKSLLIAGVCVTALVAAAGAIVLGPQTSQAQAPPAKTFEYAAKIVCGKARRSFVEAGFYSVAVNVHNPSKQGTAFQCKVALAGVPVLGAEGQDGQISQFKCGKIGPDRVQAFNCAFFASLPFPPGSIPSGTYPFFEGFFVIQSPTKLDVTAYYTSVGISGTAPNEFPSKVYSPSIAVERIAERVLIDGIPE